MRNMLMMLFVVAGLAGCQSNKRMEEIQAQKGRLMKSLARRIENTSIRMASAKRHLGVLRSRMSIVERQAPQAVCAISELEKQGVTVTPDGTKLVVAIADKVLFDSGEASLKEDAAMRLSKIIAVINKTFPDRTLSIEGHTDSRHPDMTADKYANNWALSSARAISVARFLVEKVGIDPKTVNALAFGDTKPICKNDTKEGRATNRRVEIVVLPKIETTVVSADL